jgi:hypothetical protein
MMPPDTIYSVTLMIVLICFYSVFTIINLILVLLRRNDQPVKARHVPFIVFHLIGLWICCFLGCFRVIYSRAKFPCLLYTAVYLIGVPIMFLPNVFRCYRLLLIFKLSRFKANIHQDHQETNKRNNILMIKRLLHWSVTTLSSIILIVFQVSLWLILSGISSISNPVYLSFSTGCFLGYFSYTILVTSGLYIFIDFILICLLIKGVRDTWGIRYEVFIISALWLLCLIVFGIEYFVPQYGNVYEYYVPSGTALFVGFVQDLFFSCTLPCLLSFMKIYNKNAGMSEPSDNIQFILKNDEYRELLKKFAVESFCPESILCWEDIHKYKLLTSDRERIDCIHMILQSYIEQGSPVELNLPGQLKFYINDLSNLVETYKENESRINSNILDQLEEHCLADIVDIFSRFKRSQNWQKISQNLIKVKQENEILHQTGMT